jgi:hypothetical protein
MSRWENAPDLHEMIGLMRIMVGLYCDSYAKPPSAVTLDIAIPAMSFTAISNSRCSMVTGTVRPHVRGRDGGSPRIMCSTRVALDRPA